MRRQGNAPTATNGEGVNNEMAAGDRALESSLAPLDEIARHVDGTFVVVVKVSAGKYRRRCFLTAASAQRAAARATARGESATVYLAELRPLWKLTGDAR